MPTVSDHCLALAGKITGIFAAGFQADAATVHFIDSTFNCPDQPALTAILNDPGHDDREGLIDLILAPDTAAVREIEALLERWSYSVADLRTVLSLLPAEMATRVRVGEIKASIGFTVPGACLRQFLSQLHLTRPIDPEIRLALATRLPSAPDRLEALLRIRQTRTELTANHNRFLLNFIHQSGETDTRQWFFYLDFILDLLDRDRTDGDVFGLFAADKQYCLIQVEQSRRLAEQLQKNNMETLLLCGQRIGLAADVPGLLHRMNLIDDICRLVWGRMPVALAAEMVDADAVSFLFEKQPPG